MLLTPETIGKTIRDTRKKMGVTQKDLALTSGTGLRFVIDLEKGKPTCHIGKALTVRQCLTNLPSDIVRCYFSDHPSS